MTKIAYNALVVIDVDPENAGNEWRELAAQLRTAAQHVVSMGAPEPGGDSDRIEHNARVTTILSAVELPDYTEPPLPAPDPWTNPDAASASAPPPF